MRIQENHASIRRVKRNYHRVIFTDRYPEGKEQRVFPFHSNEGQLSEEAASDTLHKKS